VEDGRQDVGGDGNVGKGRMEWLAGPATQPLELPAFEGERRAYRELPHGVSSLGALCAGRGSPRHRPNTVNGSWSRCEPSLRRRIEGGIERVPIRTRRGIEVDCCASGRRCRFCGGRRRSGGRAIAGGGDNVEGGDHASLLLAGDAAPVAMELPVADAE